MASLLGMAKLILSALPQVILNGWAAMLLAVTVVLVFAQYRRLAATEAELYGIAKHAPLHQTQQALVMGVLGGVVGSFVLSLAGVGLVEVPGATSALLYLWPVSLALGAVNPRFFCFAYGATLVSLSYLITGWPRVDIPSMLGMVAALHMVEALLIWVSGSTCATPLSISDRFGEAVPGYLLQRFWPVPLVLPLFSAAGGAPVDMPAWWPLLPPDTGLGEVTAQGWHLIPVVVTMGYSDLAITAAPQERARRSSGTILLYSGLLMALAIGAGYFRPLLWVAALFSAVGHEVMAVWSGRLEMLGLPYLRRPPRGVGILDVLPGTPGAAAGLVSGAVILTVDDFEVHTRSELHEALLAAPAYVRIMYRHGRFLQHCRIPRPVDGVLGLGVILLPEPGDRAMARFRRPRFFRRFQLDK